MNNPDIRLGFSQARSITKEHAGIFYFASCFLPQAKQDAVSAIYLVCRESDESVDDMSAPGKQERLEKIKEDIEAVYAGSALTSNTLLAFRQSVNRFQIPKKYFQELLAGMEMDLAKNRYHSFQELYDYCYKVASVIGLIMLKVFECENPKAQNYAIDLGIAMQLTNILRDIKEDYARGRIYLPQDEMEQYGVEEKHIKEEILDYKFRRFLEFQIERAKSYYSSSKEGLKFINSRRERFVTLSIHRMYQGILEKIEQNGLDVYSRRIYLSAPERLFIALKSLLSIWV